MREFFAILPPPVRRTADEALAAYCANLACIRAMN